MSWTSGRSRSGAPCSGGAMMTLSMSPRSSSGSCPSRGRTMSVIGLSVIPVAATPALQRFVKQHDELDVLVHGFAHVNHARTHEAKAGVWRRP
jgi:hypothetical protein